MADDSLTSFSNAFPEADESQWRALVEKALKGKSPETLARKTRDGLTIKPLYRESDWPSAQNPEGLPGEAPFIRGAEVVKDVYLPWDIRQSIAHPDVKSANADILKDLQNGVSSVEIRLDASGEQGVAVQTVADMTKLLDGVMTDLAPVALSYSALEGYGLEGAALLVAWSEAQGLDAAKQQFAFNVDPIGELARTGVLNTTLETALRQTATFTAELAPVYTSSNFIRVDARPAYECGGTEAQELAFAVASGVTYLRALLDAGMSLKDANAALLFSLSVGPDYALEIAKLRAMRRLWARVTESFGEILPMRLQAVTARRMLTVRDPWVNMLRNAAACFAAGVGGADVVTVRPFTDAIGLAGSLARRIGRNTQIMAQEESSLGRVTDPAGGTWAIGKISDELAQTAWTLFQEIERKGGIGPSLTSGNLQNTLSASREALKKDISKRKQAITGVSEFALIEEETPTIVDLSSIAPARPAIEGPEPASRDFADLVSAASNGASLTRLLEDELDTHAQCDPLFPMRLSEPYEALRDHADAKAAKTGKRPEVFLACLGAIPEYNARAGFAANFFAAGGIAATTGAAPYDTLEALVADFKASRALLVCICSSDPCYAEHAERAAKALKEARSDARVYLAGKPGDAEAAYRAAGVDDFIYVGVDVIGKLEIAHAELGVDQG